MEFQERRFLWGMEDAGLSEDREMGDSEDHSDSSYPSLWIYINIHLGGLD